MNPSALRADLLLLLTALIWGCAFVAQRTGMEHIGPFAFNGIRFALGALVLVPVMLRFRLPPPTYLTPSGASSRLLFPGGVLAGAVLFAGATLQQAGMVETTAGKAGFITGLYVVMVPIAGLAFRQRAGMGTWVGALLAAAGLYLLSVTESLALSRGDALVLAGTLFWTAHVLLIGRLSPRLDPVRLAAVQFTTCSVLSLAVALVTEPFPLAGIHDAGWAILFAGIMSVGVAYTLQVVAQRQAKPAHAAIILSLETVFAALAGWLLLGEMLSARELTGCALMLGGMLASQLRP